MNLDLLGTSDGSLNNDHPEQGCVSKNGSNPVEGMSLARKVNSILLKLIF